MTHLLPVDHIVVLVRDLEPARAAFMQAGFTATPVARHSEAMGTANSCIMLDGVYIELMGIVAETPANESWRALLAAGQGLKGIALASDDIEATAAMLASKGIAGEARDFSRAMPEGDLRFSVIRLPRELTPGLQCIYCQHHTRGLLWTPQAMRHDNGARRILSVGAPGVSALVPFTVSRGGLAVEEREAGCLLVEARKSISAECRKAIADETGIAIETRPLA
ncbi:VOC family protein [Chelativorans sp. AA-79]|uniref:VOC family protein n=1 Tax=Chelativorans sp. AA-79 TaxID=3028735 RepID=UPI0023F998F2|nr:VOC family protein [Chelativorans sp. AA-79]WEX08899.1 VOC family protein [Chelativorans sp. AA-79]